MKKIFSLFAAVLFAGSMMAAEVTATWTVKTGALGSGIGTGTFEDSEENSWSYERTLVDGASYTGSINNGYLQLGKNGGVENLTLSTSAITGVIKSVSVDCACYQGKHKVAITVGEDTYLAATAVPTWSSNAGGVKTGEGTSTGKITISFTDGTRAMYIKSISVTYEAGAETKVATPKFSLAEGEYEGTQSVEITCKTEGATIYYTTDGTAPTTTSNVYSAAIEVAKTTTIKAFAAKTGLDNSDVVEATYTIVPGADVILDFTDNTDWKFPTDAKTTEVVTYSNGDYSVSVSAGAQYYTDNAQLLVGKTDAYLVLPKFEGKAISKIVTVGCSNGSGSVTFNVYDGSKAVSTEVTSCKVDQTFAISPKRLSKEYKIKITNDNNARFSKIKIWFGEPDPDTREVVSAVSFTGFEGYFKVGMTWNNDAMTALYNRIQPGEGTGDWWQKNMQNLNKWNEATEQYEYVDDSPGTVLTAGKYIFAAQIRIEGEEAQTKRLPKAGETPNMTVTVDGVNWPYTNDAVVEDDYSYDWIVSPEFTLTDTGTGVEDVMSGKVSTKVLRDGVLIIERDGVRYNVLGEIVR